MAINYATLAKEIDGVIQYIYPKTAAELVEYSATQSVKDKIDEMDTTLRGININQALTSYFTKSEVKDLIYRPIRIRHVHVSPEVMEVGSTQAVTVYWDCDQVPAALNIDGVRIAVPTQSGSKVFTNITNDRTFTVSATDAGTDNINPFTDNKAATAMFFNGIYWGAAKEPAEYNSSFILTLGGKELKPSPAGLYNANPGADQYIYFACPSNFTPIFNAYGFIGGFMVAATINFTNVYAHTVAYTIYRTVNADLGHTAFMVFA